MHAAYTAQHTSSGVLKRRTSGACGGRGSPGRVHACSAVSSSETQSWSLGALSTAMLQACPLSTHPLVLAAERRVVCGVVSVRMVAGERRGRLSGGEGRVRVHEAPLARGVGGGRHGGRVSACYDGLGTPATSGLGAKSQHCYVVSTNEGAESNGHAPSLYKNSTCRAVL